MCFCEFGIGVLWCLGKGDFGEVFVVGECWIICCCVFGKGKWMCSCVGCFVVLGRLNGYFIGFVGNDVFVYVCFVLGYVFCGKVV